MKVGCKLHLEWPTKKLVQVAGTVAVTPLRHRAKWLAEGQQYRNHNSIVTIKIVGIADIPWRPSQWLECCCDWPKRGGQHKATNKLTMFKLFGHVEENQYSKPCRRSAPASWKSQWHHSKRQPIPLEMTPERIQVWMEWWSSAEPCGCGEINI